MSHLSDNQQLNDAPSSGDDIADSPANVHAAMSDVVESLIDRWETARENGRELTPEELCIEHPNLLDEVREQIAALKWIPSPHECEPSGADGLECGAAPHESFAAESVLAGRYRLVESVGEGGFGSVWRGFDTELQRFVAIKIPRGLRARSLANDRFLAEARRLAKLRHPGIVPVFDVGRHDGVVFIVSDFINGHALTEELAAGAIPAPRLITVVTQLAEALHAAHGQGFIHRDVKPANILLDDHGHTYLTDFGIAVETEAQLTPSGLSGTLSYMAPEQARGTGEPVDARTDVFALGVVLYELLTGRRPFVADSPSELRQRIIQAQPVPPRELDRKIPSRLTAVCLRALARDPADRFASALDMAQAVQKAVTSPLPKRLIPVVIVFAVVVAVTGFLAINREAEPPDARATTPELTVSASRPAATSTSRGTDSLTSQLHDAPADAAPIRITATQVFRGHTGAVSSLAISAGGQRVLSGSWDKTMRLWDTTSGQLIREFRGHAAGIGGVALSPDDRTAASGAGHLYRDATLRLWDVETGDELARFEGHEHNIMAVAWAPNGEFLVTGSLDNTIRRWRPDHDAAGDTAGDSTATPAMTLLGTVRRPNINNWPGQVWAVAISPNSRQVLAGLRDHTARLIDAESGRQLRSLGGHTDQVRCITFSSDGTHALTASLDGTVRLWNLAAGETIHEYHPGLGALNTVIFGSGESTLLCGGQHDTFVMLEIETGRTVGRFTGHTEQIMALRVTPSGDVLSASHDATVRRWHVTDSCSE